MHEMSLAEGVLQIIEDHRAQNSFNQVTELWLEIGQMSGVEAGAMEFCLQSVLRGTVAEHAKVVITRPEGKGLCISCNKEVPMLQRYDPCCECGNFGLQPIAGTEMQLKELLVD
ncbi:hydrogenase maturation nickel metallochaperone HypA/HybF [Pelagibaculum spongiae]|uniref:Hydrogenase maturation factor HypA n=1 Tax=Pelagibaculum spongiae TaxID=2080658 RepID=A0A2V1H1P7_9GAMM|nr:hydrogenase maturation nickel metallochaperone HypA [Pelagibaculum spongiae]PVZ68806.1 hydrogenase maturation nickel metallochaperone HypA [Pelagibaculum spongiae]